MRKYDSNHLIGVILELVTQSENDLLLSLLPIEQDFYIIVVLHQLGKDKMLVMLQSVRERIQDIEDRSHLVHEVCVSLRLDAIPDKRFDRLANFLGREVISIVSVVVIQFVQRSFELGRYAARERREHGAELRVRQVRVAQDLDEFAYGRLRERLVVISFKYVIEHTLHLAEPLDGLVAVHLRRPHDGWLACERNSMLDAGGVVEGEDTNDVAGFEGSTRLLNKLDGAVLRGDERHEQTDELARARTAKLCWVALLLQLASLAINHETRAAHLVAVVGRVALAIQKDEKTAISKRTHSDLRLAAVQMKSMLKMVLRYLTLLERPFVLLDTLVGHLVRLGDGATQHGEHGIRPLGSDVGRDEGVEPAGVDSVLFKVLRLEKADEILHCGSKVAANGQLFEGDDHVLACLLPVLAVCEDVAKLRVRELMQPTGGDNGEVTPDVCGRTEVELLHDTRRGLESGVRVFGCNTHSNDVALGGRLTLCLERLWARELKVDLGGARGLHAVEGADVADAMQWNTHRDLELRGGEIDARDHFGGRMLDLQTRVEFEEVEVVMGVRILDGTGRDITDELGEPDGRFFHRFKGLLLGNGDRRLLDDLLVTTLHRAIAAEEGDGVAVLVGQQLNLKMTRVARELHDENGRAGHLAQNLSEGLPKPFLTHDLADTLAATALGSLDHDRESDLDRGRETLLGRGDASLLIDIVGNNDVTLGVVLGVSDVRTTPVHGGNLSRLRHNRRRDLITKGAHGRSGGADKDDLLL
ncbi:LOW QUALITY PROTEIN: hypothetical protein BC937DRAFT_90266 [Endogone sp. FLAS-F59071]|nr:LOW QUALITY PROTEIN: hypothetical protein BC937DRAFT_90266 [Endogone sp. FLAS-F59071]|eukprot:RUS22134.1 LOW QUALITY PROTEIN: hypothetical protein BC937DRAFT_90266 [Endogone sp. FLAS-F59071]